MAIRNENKNKLFTIFKNTRNIRKKIIQTGQDTKVPNFGRKN